jgi:hypothetical protein
MQTRFTIFVLCLVLIIPLLIGCTREANTQYLSSESTTDAAVSEQAVTDPYGIVLYDPPFKDTTNFPLYAAIPQEGIYLYGIKEDGGMVLYHNGNGQYFNWPGLTPHLVLPQMNYFDYDGDGTKEIAVTLYVGSGTGLAMMDLHILKLKSIDYGYMTEYHYEDIGLSGNTDIEKIIKKSDFTYSVSKDKSKLEVEFKGKQISTDYYWEQDKHISGIGYGSIVYFNLKENNEIEVKIGIGVNVEEYHQPLYFGYVTAKVHFDGKSFSFGDYDLIANE